LRVLKYGLALLGAWLLLLEFGHRLHPSYWTAILTIR
jgi:hypothetical protein